jgi:uncharacterized protein involved in tolerance to divalent cations
MSDRLKNYTEFLVGVFYKVFFTRFAACINMIKVKHFGKWKDTLTSCIEPTGRLHVACALQVGQP